MVETKRRGPTRIRVFVDYWNFQLTLNEIEGQELGIEDHRFLIDCRVLGKRLAQLAASAADIGDSVYEGVNIYTSYDPRSEQGAKYHRWATTWLDRQPGVQVDCRKRQRRGAPRCAACHRLVETCPECGDPMSGTVEKGVDTLIATDMIRMAWDEAFDVAVLATSDADLVPAVEFLNHRTRRVIQAGFPPRGFHLATACWASFDIYPHRDSFRRAE